jgi:hypothetical protein
MGLRKDVKIALDGVVAAAEASSHSASKVMMRRKGDLRKVPTKDSETFFLCQFLASQAVQLLMGQTRMLQWKSKPEVIPREVSKIWMPFH